MSFTIPERAQAELSAGVGTRGGPTPPMSVDRALELIETWRPYELRRCKEMILVTALIADEFHSDALADVVFDERNVVGVAIRALVQSRMIVSTGEHRKGKSAASHGRRSYVYRLTERGREDAEKLLAALEADEQEVAQHDRAA